MNVSRALRRSLLAFAPLALLAGSVQAQFGGTGADGAFLPTTNTTLNTNANNGIFNFTDIEIPFGVTVQVIGENAAILLATGNVLIEGTLRVVPGHGMMGGEASPGYALEALHTEIYDSQYAQLPIGGTSSIGCAQWSTKPGGGYLEMSAFGFIEISGTVTANGTSGACADAGSTPVSGSGGTIVLRTLEILAVSNTGFIQAIRGLNGAQNGLIRFESPEPMALSGDFEPAPWIDHPQRVLGHAWSVTSVAPYVLTESDASGVLSTSDLAHPRPGFGICTTLRGARWVTNPTSNQIETYGRNGTNLLPSDGLHSTGQNPRGIAADRFGQVWVACTDELTQHDTWGSAQLIVPLPGGNYGVAVDAEDRVWVTNETMDRLYCVAQDGTVIGSYPVGDGPRGVAVDRHGDIWVALASGAVVKTDSEGQVLFTVPVDPNPVGIACDAADQAWVACEGDLLNPGDRIFRISGDGSLVTSHLVGRSPTSVSILGDGSVAIVNTGDATMPVSSYERLSPADGTSLATHSLPDMSIAFGDSTGYGAALAFDHFGDLDADGDTNIQEMLFSGDVFDPTTQSQNGKKVIDSIDPVHGVLAGGTSVTLKGGPFTFSWDTSLIIGGQPATDIAVLDDTTITAVTGPNSTQGRADVSFSDSSGTATLADGFYYTNVGLGMSPEDGLVGAPGYVNLVVNSHPLTPLYLALGFGVGTTPVGGLTLEVPSPVFFLLNPQSSPFPIGTDALGTLSLTLSIPNDPGLVGAQFSLASAIFDPACTPTGYCLSNGVVVTIQ